MQISLQSYGLLGSVPYPGIGKSLEEMKRTGLRIYPATSKRAIFASRILDHLKFAIESGVGCAKDLGHGCISSRECKRRFDCESRERKPVRCKRGTVSNGANILLRKKKPRPKPGQRSGVRPSAISFLASSRLARADGEREFGKRPEGTHVLLAAESVAQTPEFTSDRLYEQLRSTAI